MNKITWITLTLVVALGLIYLVTKKETVSVGVKQLQFPVFVKEDVTRIEIEGSDSFVLTKDKDTWYVQESKDENAKKFIADTNKISLMLDSALGMKSVQYVSNIKEKFPDFGFTKEGEVLINIFSKDKKVWSVLLGNSINYFSRYARLADSDSVYSVKANFNNLVKTKLADLRERKLTSLQENELTKISLLRGKDTNAVFVKKDEKWHLEGHENFRLSAESLDRFIKIISNTASLEFFDEPINLVNPEFMIELENKNALTQKLSFYKEKNMFLVFNETTKQTFKIGEYVFEQLNKKLEDFRNLSVLKFDLGAIKKIVLNEQKQKIVFQKENEKWEIKEPGDIKEKIIPEANILDFLNQLLNLKAKSLADAKEYVANDQKWLEKNYLELVDNSGNTIYLKRSSVKNNPDYELINGNADDKIYLINKKSIFFLNKGLSYFQNSPDLPIIDERTQGFETLPIEVKRQLLKNNEEIRNKKAN